MKNNIRGEPPEDSICSNCICFQKGRCTLLKRTDDRETSCFFYKKKQEEQCNHLDCKYNNLGDCAILNFVDSNCSFYKKESSIDEEAVIKQRLKSLFYTAAGKRIWVKLIKYPSITNDPFFEEEVEKTILYKKKYKVPKIAPKTITIKGDI